jgi:HSP20 family protein
MLLRFDPFRELDRLATTAIDRPRPLPLDAFQEGDHFIVQIDMPGIDPEAIDITVEKNVLTVKAERRNPRTERELVVGERSWGTFTRQLFLGDTLDPDRLEAHYDRGVLTLSLPVAESAKPRKVNVTEAVTEGAGQGSIEAHAS